jgi:hypothetical protein
MWFPVQLFFNYLLKISYFIIFLVYFFFLQQNRKTCKRTNSTVTTITQWKKTKKEFASRPTRRLMKNYFWISLFTLCWIREKWAYIIYAILIANKEFKKFLLSFMSLFLSFFFQVYFHFSILSFNPLFRLYFHSVFHHSFPVYNHSFTSHSSHGYTHQCLSDLI